MFATRMTSELAEMPQPLLTIQEMRKIPSSVMASMISNM